MWRKYYGENMNKKTTGIMIVLVLLGVLLSGCVEPSTTPVKQYEIDNGVADVTLGKTFNYESKFTEANQERLITANPPPKLDRSLERQNLINRNTEFSHKPFIFW